MSTTLPAPAAAQAYMHVSALDAGLITLASKLYIKDPAPGEVFVCPSLAFFLRHSHTDAHLVFDLGLRKDTSGYPPRVHTLLRDVFPVHVEQDVAESLAKGGVRPEEVETVLLSHLHFDHIGDHTPFTNATFLLGAGSRGVLDKGYPTDPSSGFLAASVPHARTHFLTPDDFTTSIGPFPRALDLFGDGSLYVIDAPGHLEGHTNLLARTSADGAWIFLGGDTCHDLRLLTGEREMFYELDDAGNVLRCAHEDKDAAKEHIKRVAELRGMRGVHVLVAHDWEWYEKNKGGEAFLPGRIPPARL